MDHDTIVEQLLDRCKRLLATILQAPDLHSVASAALAIVVQMRQGARDMLPAKIALEAQQLRGPDVAHGCPEASMQYVHTRTVSPATLLGEIAIPVRTFQCSGCGATCRPDDAALGVPEVGDFTDAVRYVCAPVAAEWPHRVANALVAQCPGVALSSRGAQGLIDRTAEDLRRWQAEHERQEAAAVADVLGTGDGVADLRVEIAMDGVTAHIDGRWQPPQVATILVRRLETQAEEPTLGTVVARRSSCVLGAAAELAVRSTQVLREAGWEPLPLGAIVGDGAPWLWNAAAAYFPGVRQTLDDDHLSEPLYACAHLLYPHNPAGAKAWVDQNLGALLPDRVGEVLGALQRRRPWKKVVHAARAQLIGYREHTQPRMRYQEPWPSGLAVGSGAVAGACTPVMHRRFTRAGMRGKPPGFLNVLALRLARLNGTFQSFWASRGLAIPASG